MTIKDKIKFEIQKIRDSFWIFIICIAFVMLINVIIYTVVTSYNFEDQPSLISRSKAAENKSRKVQFFGK